MPARLTPAVPLATGGRSAGRTGLLQITTAGVLWGTSGMIAQLVHRSTGMGAAEISFWRLAVSATAMLLIALPRVGRLQAAVRRHPAALAAAGVGLAGYQVLYFVAVTTAGVNLATMVSLGTAPVVAALWETARSRRRPGLRQSVVIVVAVVGLVLVAGGRSAAAGPRPGLGVLAALGSGVLYGASALLGRRLARDTPAVAMTTVTSVVGAVVLAPAAVLSAPSAVPAGAPLPLGVAWGAVGVMGVLATAVAYVLFNRGLQRTESSVAAVLTLVEPLTAAALAVTVLSEPVTGTTVVGAGLLLAAVGVLYLAPGPAGRTAAGGAPAGVPAGLPEAGVAQDEVTGR